MSTSYNISTNTKCKQHNTNPVFLPIFQNLEQKMATNVPLKHITEAYARIKPFVHQTPVLTCSTFDKIASENANKPIQLFFKTENLQKTGAFKARGACNAVLLAKEKFQDDLNGIVTHSSGNHGQAVAYACSKVIF